MCRESIDISCRSKNKYPTYRSAVTTMRAARRMHRANHQVPIRAYRCSRCGHWHLTSTKKEKESNHEF